MTRTRNGVVPDHPAFRGPRSAVALAILIGLLPPSSLGAQALVLRSPGSTRAAGFNGAGAALMGDAGSVFSNPVGLAIIHHIAVEAAYRRTPAGEYLAGGAAAWRLGQFDVGGGAQLYRNADPAATREELGVASLVYRFGLIAVGASGKMLTRTTPGGGGTFRAQGTGVDAGLAIAVFDIMAIAASVQNIGGNLRDGSPLLMARLSRLGFSMNYVDPQGSFRLMSVVEVQWPEQLPSRVVLGGEAGTVVRGVGVVGRLAYGSRWLASPSSTITYGGSVVLGRFVADYAFVPSTDLPESRHRFGIRLNL